MGKRQPGVTRGTLGQNQITIAVKDQGARAFPDARANRAQAIVATIRRPIYQSFRGLPQDPGLGPPPPKG
jgi:hypothetical protein